jgi:hypothetical protein
MKNEKHTLATLPAIDACKTRAQCDDAINAVYAMFPQFKPLSLDEWIHEYWEQLDKKTRDWAIAMCDHYMDMEE